MTRARDFADVISGQFDIPVGSLDNAVVGDGGITTAKLADAAVTTAKLTDANITTAKLADGSVTGAKLSVQSSDFKMTDLTSNSFYRTGTWTPIFSSSGATSPNVSDIFTGSSYTNQYGQYERIGDLVHVYCKLELAASVTYQNGGATNQALVVSGFPFNIKTNSSYFPMSSGMYSYTNNNSGWTGYTWTGMMMQSAKKSMAILYGVTNGMNTGIVTDHMNNGTTSEMGFSITYCTDDA